MTPLGRCPLSIFCSRGTPVKHKPPVCRCRRAGPRARARSGERGPTLAPRRGSALEDHRVDPASRRVNPMNHKRPLCRCRRARACSGERGGQQRPPGHLVRNRLGTFFFFFFPLVTGPRRSLSLKLSDTRVYSVPPPHRGLPHSSQFQKDPF